MITAGMGFFIFGVVLIGTSLINPDFYFKNYRFINVVKILGRTGARILVGSIGLGLIIYGMTLH